MSSRKYYAFIWNFRVRIGESSSTGYPVVGHVTLGDSRTRSRIVTQASSENCRGIPIAARDSSTKQKLLANHPYVATHHGLEESDGVQFLVMERLDIPDKCLVSFHHAEDASGTDT